MAASNRAHEASHSDSALSASARRARPIEGKRLSSDELLKIDSCWRTSLYLCMGMLRRRHVPAAVAGIVFLSGGQDDGAATAHLNGINRLPGTKPSKIAYSYGRALQDHALETWHGRDENLAAPRRALYQRARCNSAASLGSYTDEMENTLVSVANPPRRREWDED